MHTQWNLDCKNNYHHYYYRKKKEKKFDVILHVLDGRKADQVSIKLGFIPVLLLN